MLNSGYSKKDRTHAAHNPAREKAVPENNNIKKKKPITETGEGFILIHIIVFVLPKKVGGLRL